MIGRVGGVKSGNCVVNQVQDEAGMCVWRDLVKESALDKM